MVALETLHLFKNLAPEELHILRAITQERKIAAGGEIFREGDPGDGLYFVKSGLVEISGLINATERRVFSQLAAGEIFGEMSVIEDRPRSATATALKETEIYFIPRNEMLALLQRSPALAFNLLQEISHRLRDFSQLHLREVVQAERLAVVGNFARSIIHDLKTPLTIIGLSADMACAANSTPERRAQSQERIRKQVLRINDMVGDILEYTRTTRTETTTLAKTAYADFIKEILPELQAETENKSVHIEIQGEPPATKLLLDSRRLRRVFSTSPTTPPIFCPAAGKFSCASVATKKKSSQKSRTPAPASRPPSPTNFSSHSPRTENHMARDSAFPSAKKSSKTTKAASGRAASRSAARFFASRCRW
jgi:CRP-like cAMP-binding protein